MLLEYFRLREVEPYIYSVRPDNESGNEYDTQLNLPLTVKYWTLAVALLHLRQRHIANTLIVQRKIKRIKEKVGRVRQLAAASDVHFRVTYRLSGRMDGIV